MRILFINTVDQGGGAAIVMQRLIKGLIQSYATENLVLVKEKKGCSQDTLPLLTNPAQIISEKIIDRLTRKTGLLYQFFPFSSNRLVNVARSFRPHIINLHNTQSGYFATPLIARLSKIAPIVWTLHDMWSFTANAAHTFGNMSWRELKNDSELAKIPPSISLNTGKWLLRQKKTVYAKSDLTLVSPSIWLKKMAEQSPVFEGKNIHHIYNGIDSTVYKPKDKLSCKSKIGAPLDCKTVMFSAQDLDSNNPWKGGADLIAILSKMSAITERKINFLAVGKGNSSAFKSVPNVNIINTGYVHSETDMCDYLNAADLFIYPTRADNLPNVLVESIACNTPCITFDIGGNKEIISNNANGLIIPPFDLDMFAADAVSLLHDEKRLAQFSSACSSIVKERFQLRSMVDLYYTLFKKIRR
jgi:glycosyltransferase involved in cell wall biosynthesis